MNTENAVENNSDGTEEGELDFRYYILNILNNNTFCI